MAINRSVLFLVSFSLFGASLGIRAQPYFSDALITDPDAEETVGVIDGLDFYEVERYESFDRTSRPQRQQAKGFSKDHPQELPYWQFYRNDFDSYQEKQNERFIQWQKRVGIRPKRY